MEKVCVYEIFLIPLQPIHDNMVSGMKKTE